MTFGRVLKLLGFAVAAAAALPVAANAQSHPEFIPLGRVAAALYKPDAGPAPHVAFLVSHRTANNLNNNACKELAKRGFLALCWNTRFVNNEAAVRWEDIAFDVKTTVDYVRSIPGITKVVLLGHSGGSPLMSYYEAVAEAGPEWCKNPNKLVQCTGNMAGFKPADGIVFPDAHPGNGVQSLRGLNPSIFVQKDGSVKVDPALDPYNTANGFNPEGASHYSKEFQARYYTAQSKQMNELIGKAQARVAELKKQALYSDDDVFAIVGGGFSGAGAGSSDLNSMDPSIPELMATARAEKVLKNDGSIVMEIAHSVAVPEPENAKANHTFERGTKVFTLKSFLSANAVKSTNSLDGVDWCSSNNSTMCAVQSIKIPTLIAAMGAFHFVRDQEMMYDLSAAKDKDYIVIEGALHGYTPCKACEKTPGQYANSDKNLFDYIAKWTNERF